MIVGKPYVVRLSKEQWKAQQKRLGRWPSKVTIVKGGEVPALKSNTAGEAFDRSRWLAEEEAAKRAPEIY